MESKNHLVIPPEVLEEVDKIAGKKKRGLFMTEATREKLGKERFLKTLEETHGTWTDPNHPELRTKKDMECYMREKRQSHLKRT